MTTTIQQPLTLRQRIALADCLDGHKLTEGVSPLSVGDAAEAGYDADISRDVTFRFTLPNPYSPCDLLADIGDTGDFLARTAIEQHLPDFEPVECRGSFFDSNLSVICEDGENVAVFTITVEADLKRA